MWIIWYCQCDFCLRLGSWKICLLLKISGPWKNTCLISMSGKSPIPLPYISLTFTFMSLPLGKTTTALITRHSSSLPTNCWDCLYKVCNYSHTSRDNFYLTLVSITDTNFILFKPSLVAAAAVMAARAILGMHPHWMDHMTAITGYCFEELQVVATMMMQLFYNYYQWIVINDSVKFSKWIYIGSLLMQGH